MNQTTEQVATTTLVGQAHWELGPLLGRGASGRTHRVTDRASGRVAVAKLMDLRDLADWKAVELCEREVGVLEGLVHPNVPRYIEHFRSADGATLVLVMEEARGEPLARRFGAKSVSASELVAWLVQGLEVLVYLHERQPAVVHRDVTTNNLMVDGPHLSLIDFGSVKASLATSTAVTSVGTFGFMAPEQFQGRAYASTDLYGLGATLLNIMTGRPPADLPHVGLGLDVRAIIPGQPYIETWLVRMLTPDPDSRFDSAASALASLRAGRIERVAPTPRPEPIQRPSPPPRDPGRVAEEPFPLDGLLVIALITAALIIGGYFIVMGGK